MMLIASVLIVAIGICSAEAKNGFDGYKVHRLTLETAEQLAFLAQLNDDMQRQYLSDEIEIWTDTARLSQNVTQPVLVMVSPKQESRFLSSIEAHGIKHDIAIPNLAAAIEKESRMGPQDLEAIRNGSMTWTAYHRYATIETYISNLARDNRDLVEISTIGQSYEGRNLYLLKIGKARADGATKPAIWIDSQIHAREWIASATVTWIINKMVTEYGTNAIAKKMLDDVDWYVLPVVNVDGFEFTKTPGNRMNRLTRRVNPFSPRTGTDPNRNFDHKWMFDGASQSPGTEVYAGPHPYSEIEDFWLTESVLKHQKQIKTLLTVHSHGQMWLLPWGYDMTRPSDYDDLMKMGTLATDALKAKHKTEYLVGSSTEILGPAAGATDDWGKAKGMIKYSYTVELRDSPRLFPFGRDGFILPPEQIIPSGEETFEALVVVADIVAKEFPVTPAP